MHFPVMHESQQHTTTTFLCAKKFPRIIKLAIVAGKHLATVVGLFPGVSERSVTAAWAPVAKLLRRAAKRKLFRFPDPFHPDFSL